MQKYSREIVNEVLAANDVVDIVGASVELKTAGAGRLKGLCPFHHEKTPSFVVDRHRQTFHCFGCGKGGDALTFLMDHDGLTFMEGLKKLADRGGVRLPAFSAQSGSNDGLRTELLAFNAFVSAHCRGILEHPQQGGPGRAYLVTRQLNENTERRFELGYLPDGWQNLVDAVRAKGYRDALLEASGLFKKGERGGWYDFFRNRLIIPIRDLSGNVVAFGGRDLSGESPAKYINSPETAVYKKSRVLYGLNEAREALRREKFAILVEGYFDLLRCFDAGIENVVASCGTALTAEQANLIRRYVPEVVVVYDGDAAGIKAALKGTAVLTAAGLAVRALALPDNQDPDDFVRAQGGDALRKLLTDAPDFVTFYVRMSGDRLRSIEGRTEVAREIFDILKEMDDAVRVDEYLRHTAKAMGLQEHACRREFEQYRRQGLQQRLPVMAAPAAPAQPLVSRDDSIFVAGLLNNPKLVALVRERLQGVALAASPLQEVLAVVLEGGRVTASQDFESEDARRLYSAAATLEPPDAELAEAIVEKRMNRLERSALTVEIDRVQAELGEAERQQDMTRTVRLVAQRALLQQRMQQVGLA